MTNQPEGHSPTVTVPTSSTATISLIAGILGLTLFPVIGSIVAVITGVMARREIRKTQGALGGQGIATVGLILGWIGLAILFLGLCVAGVAFGLPMCAALFALGAENVNLLVPIALAVV